MIAIRNYLVLNFTYRKSKTGDVDSNSTDSELIEFTLHHLVRRSDKPCAKQLRINDEKFSFYREYEDRVRNRRCCCESSLEKFGNITLRGASMRDISIISIRSSLCIGS